MTFQDLK